MMQPRAVRSRMTLQLLGQMKAHGGKHTGGPASNKGGAHHPLEPTNDGLGPNELFLLLFTFLDEWRICKACRMELTTPTKSCINISQIRLIRRSRCTELASEKSPSVGVEPKTGVF
jgi:hypothetical protein